MSEQPNESQSFDIRVEWDTDSRSVPDVVNQTFLRPGIGDLEGRMQGVYLQLGHVNPPFEDPQDGMVLPVVSLGNYFLTATALQQLADSCNAALEDLKSQFGDQED